MVQPTNKRLITEASLFEGDAKNFVDQLIADRIANLEPPESDATNIVILKNDDPDPDPVEDGVLYLRLVEALPDDGGDTPPPVAGIRSVGTFSAGGIGGFLEVAIPSTAQVGDLLIVGIASGTDVSYTIPSGWSSRANGTAGATSILEIEILTKTCVSSDIGSTLSMVCSPSTNKKVAAVAIVAEGTFDGVSSVSSYITSGSSREIPTMITSGNSLPILFVADRASGATPPNDQLASDTWNLPDPWVELTSAISDTTNAGVSLCVATAPTTDGAQTTPAGTAISSQTNVRAVADVVAVKGL